ncbi:MAG: anhydro-N-acetylmuramic acid kinase [bacterium]|nr:anhydro-N-acetylmuramic acid kinase [bacterium]
MSLYTMIGAMSGTSMDGLDLVLCEIKSQQNEHYEYKILNSKTFEYPKQLLEKLVTSKLLPTTDLYELDKILGKHYALCINNFLKSLDKSAQDIDAIASHGHTVFHQPEKGYTVQIGCGTTISMETGIPVINDFRQRDVIAGGQGAPLVPIGDQLLFGDRADAYLNIGGFTNISIPSGETIAFDICPGNLPLNITSQELGLSYDENGALARSGVLHQEVLDKLNALSFYHQKAPKSLGTEWLEQVFMPIMSEISVPKDRLHTTVHHIADQVAKVYRNNHIDSLFITGGGAFNGFLMEQLTNRGVKIILPSEDEINFKEALIFAFLGVRFLEGKYNCLASVTGASTNVCGGILHRPK